MSGAELGHRIGAGRQWRGQRDDGGSVACLFRGGTRRNGVALRIASYTIHRRRFRSDGGHACGRDVVTLDRVVCCYPDAETLLRAAAQRARKLVAFTYPRDRWYVRAFIKFENFWQRLRRSELRAFVHPPKRMHAVLERAGLVRAASEGTAVWMFDLYRRETASVPPRS